MDGVVRCGGHPFFGDDDDVGSHPALLSMKIRHSHQNGKACSDSISEMSLSSSENGLDASLLYGVPSFFNRADSVAQTSILLCKLALT